MVCALAGCATVAWYGQAARGQLEVLAKREDIADKIADPATPESLRARLVTVLEIRRFAVDELGLPDGRSYRLYADLGRDSPLWNVVATPAWSVEAKSWCYPLVGCLSYRGFFRRDHARDLAAELAGEGLDVAVFPVTAYSTLGWFADPLLDSMLSLSDARLAELIFHELTHELLHVRGDTPFNEAYATFIGRLGTARWLESTGRSEALSEWWREQRADRELTNLLLEARQRLSKGFDRAEGEAALAAVKAAEYQRLREQIAALARAGHGDRLDAWLAGPINNAHLALVATYEAGVAAFERVYREACDRDLPCLHDRARQLAAAEVVTRREFLAGGH